VRYALESSGLGFSGGLVDAEGLWKMLSCFEVLSGFPVSGIDIAMVRQRRHQHACLQTDHCTLMKEIEKGMPHTGHTIPTHMC